MCFIFQVKNGTFILLDKEFQIIVKEKSSNFLRFFFLYNLLSFSVTQYLQIKPADNW